MSCAEPIDLAALHKGEMAGSEKSRAEAHLKSCSACTAESEKVRLVLAAVGTLPRIEPSSEFTWRTRAAFIAAHPEFLERRTEAPRRRWYALPTWSVALALQAVLIAVATILFSTPTPEEPGVASNLPGPAAKGPGSMAANVPDQLVQPTVRAAQKWTRSSSAIHDSIGPENKAAIVQAADWLVKHQLPSGQWLAGDAQYEVGVTALCTLAILDGPDASLRRAVGWLLAKQKSSGLIGDAGGNFLFNHAVATVALFDYSRRTDDQALKQSVAKAIGFSLRSQSPSGGWEYPAGGAFGSGAITAWMTLGLRLAYESGDDVVIGALDSALGRVDELTDAEGRVGLRRQLDFPNGPYVTSAAGMVAFEMSVASTSRAQRQRRAAVLLDGLKAHPVSTDAGDAAKRDLIFLHFGTLALWQGDGIEWDQWSREVMPRVRQAQQADGSWSARFDRWSSYGGQAYSTAMGALILGGSGRYPRWSN